MIDLRIWRAIDDQSKQVRSIDQSFSRIVLTLLRQNDPLFADGIFKRIFLNENICILVKISLNFVPKGPIDNMSALVQIMAWIWTCDKPLSEPMMISSLTYIYIYICISQPQWVTTSTAERFCWCHFGACCILILNDVMTSLQGWRKSLLFTGTLKKKTHFFKVFTVPVNSSSLWQNGCHFGRRLF